MRKTPEIKAFVDDLVVVADGIVAVRPVKKSVRRMKKHPAAVMPDGLVRSGPRKLFTEPGIATPFASSV